MEYKTPPAAKITPRLIIHGGAGNITPSSLPPALYAAYTSALLRILSETHHFLLSAPDRSALDTATFAVTLLEDNPLFNSGRGAVFTRDGVNELEASLMVSRGKKKRGVGVMGLRGVKNPIQLARQMLLRGEQDLEGGNGEHRGPMAARPPSGGAQGHSQMCGEGAERLAREWGVETVQDQAYFFTQQRWNEHIAGLEREKAGGMATWDREEYVSQGTCGAVALDAEGVVCVATSTGGMTNKLTGRVGDTPTLGAGFWAEEWEAIAAVPRASGGREAALPVLVLSDALMGLMADCLPGLRAYRYSPLSIAPEEKRLGMREGDTISRATGISGTGNGDSFLRMNAARTVSAIARYKENSRTSLREAMNEITGPGGELEKSAGDRWKKTGEGEGGMIGIECTVVKGRDGEIKETKSHVVLDYNCSGMFRALVTEKGKAVCRVWRKNQYEGLAGYEQEGKEYDLAELMEKW